MIPAIETFELRKVYGESRAAVEGLTLRVPQGEVFGFLGPNGAGKTTSIKMLLGLVHPSSGHATLLGQPIGGAVSRTGVGFLPEDFRFHEWMRADEFLDLHGQLYGMSSQDRGPRAQLLLDRVGLASAAAQRIKTFSKGMQQRLGLAMALLPRPELVFLDEPTSGLDPFGRMLVRDVIRAARDEGTTVFLNSHLLSEVEVTCDRVAFIKAGRVLRSGRLDEIAGPALRLRIRLEAIPEGLPAALHGWGEPVELVGPQEIEIGLPDESRIAALNAWLVGQGLQVLGLSPARLSLETLFLQVMGSSGGRSGDAA